jgi:hypothetical protein
VAAAAAVSNILVQRSGRFLMVGVLAGWGVTINTSETIPLINDRFSYSTPSLRTRWSGIVNRKVPMSSNIVRWRFAEHMAIMKLMKTIQ